MLINVDIPGKTKDEGQKNKADDQKECKLVNF